MSPRYARRAPTKREYNVSKVVLNQDLAEYQPATVQWLATGPLPGSSADPKQFTDELEATRTFIDKSTVLAKWSVDPVGGAVNPDPRHRYPIIMCGYLYADTGSFSTIVINPTPEDVLAKMPDTDAEWDIFLEGASFRNSNSASTVAELKLIHHKVVPFEVGRETMRCEISRVSIKEGRTLWFFIAATHNMMLTQDPVTVDLVHVLRWRRERG